MISIEERVRKYEQDLDNTLVGYANSSTKGNEVDKLKEYRWHINKINEIKQFGCKDYMALTALVSINYFADNYKSMNTSVYDGYMKNFGIEKKDELYTALKQETDKEKVRNIIWKECYGMDYDLISKFESDAKQESIRNNAALSGEEKVQELLVTECKCGYYNGDYHNPTYSAELNVLKTALEELRKENTIKL